MSKYFPGPLVLIILDGWGYRDTQEANAIASAQTPTWDRLWNTYPHALIAGSGHAVGLPDKQMGNSEVGHLNMGAGRIVYQDLTRIDLAIQEGDFFKNKVLCDALALAKKNQKKVHVMGLLSPGGVHSHENHFFAIAKMAATLEVEHLYFHPILDGRDTPPRSALASLDKLSAACDEYQCGKIASIIGRYYAMDRDKRWDRIKQAYELFVEGKANYTAETAQEALIQAYERGENDEFVQASTVHLASAKSVTIDDGDVILFMNFRADRAREITQALTDPSFSEFERKKFPTLGAYVCLTEYDENFKLPIAFPLLSLTKIFSEIVSDAGYKQLRIAETEKYAHVTFFFNGGVEKPYPGEDRILIPSPKVATYDLKPEMHAPELTEKILEVIKKDKYDIIICNFANADMVGHSGNFEATVKAIETIDACLGKLVPALQAKGGEILITADHGNAEQMFDQNTNQPHTAHTADPVPFIYIGRKANISIDDGKLSDIAPTMLHLLDLPQPEEMTGRSLLFLR